MIRHSGHDICCLRVFQRYGMHFRFQYSIVMSFFQTPQTNSIATTSMNTDVEIADPPTDSISSMAFSPQADYLSVASWDNSVRSYRNIFSFGRFILFYILTGSHLRDFCRRTIARKGVVPTPGTCVKRLLEQGRSVAPYILDIFTL